MLSCPRPLLCLMLMQVAAPAMPLPRVLLPPPLPVPQHPLLLLPLLSLVPVLSCPCPLPCLMLMQVTAPAMPLPSAFPLPPPPVMHHPPLLLLCSLSPLALLPNPSTPPLPATVMLSFLASLCL